MLNIMNGFPNNLISSQQEESNDNLNLSNPILFVNYYPLSKDLQQEQLQNSISIQEMEQGIDKKIKTIVNAFLDLENQPLNIIPKKGNMDLKKFLNKRILKLQKRTEKAINKLLRAKYNPQSEEQNDEVVENNKQVEKENKIEQTHLYNREMQYDSEIYDEDDIIENVTIQTDGSILIQAISAQDQLYNNQQDINSDSD